MGKLYIVATPIGNLEDITLRAIRTLKESDYIACEDTRHTSKLLNHYDISKPLLRSHGNSSEKENEKILSLLESGSSIALVSDAGTPSISDPGVFLVSLIQDKLPEVEIIPIPGPSAVITAISASGVSAATYTFLGFLPKKKGRNRLLREMSESDRTFVFYESPHRVSKTLNDLSKLCPDKTAIVARELTKQFEEIKRGPVSVVSDLLSKGNIKNKGEFTIIISK